ncbi:MAG: hypothetical protein K8H99_04420 [Nitrospirae bacterium]|mgnify:CR=1 FL=1|nr:hypothetical protein [Fimbriimonadaceae bacterium]
MFEPVGYEVAGRRVLQARPSRGRVNLIAGSCYRAGLKTPQIRAILLRSALGDRIHPSIVEASGDASADYALVYSNPSLRQWIANHHDKCWEDAKVADPLDLLEGNNWDWPSLTSPLLGMDAILQRLDKTHECHNFAQATIRFEDEHGRFPVRQDVTLFHALSLLVQGQPLDYYRLRIPITHQERKFFLDVESAYSGNHYPWTLTLYSRDEDMAHAPTCLLLTATDFALSQLQTFNDDGTTLDSSADRPYIVFDHDDDEDEQVEEYLSADYDEFDQEALLFLNEYEERCPSVKQLVDEVLRNPLFPYPVVLVADRRSPAFAFESDIHHRLVGAVNTEVMSVATVFRLPVRAQSALLERCGMDIPAFDGKVLLWNPGGSVKPVATFSGDESTIPSVAASVRAAILDLVATKKLGCWTEQEGVYRAIAERPSEYEVDYRRLLAAEEARKAQARVSHPADHPKLKRDKLTLGLLMMFLKSRLFEVSKEALKSAHSHPHGDALISLKALRTIEDILIDENWQWFASSQTGEGWKYSPRESEATLNKHGEHRPIHQGKPMQKHLTIGRNSSDRCVQIYFEVDPSKRKIIIGYCGRHLPTSSGW